MSEDWRTGDGAERAEPPVVVIDSVTRLGAGDRGKVVVCGSHGGAFSAMVAVRCAVAAIVLNDAAVGRDRAGIAGLALLEDHGVAGATVGYLSAEIGNGDDAMAHGVLSYVNGPAAQLGWSAGMTVAEALDALTAAGPAPVAATGIDRTPAENRHLLCDGSPRVWALDSASLVRQEDAGDMLFTGSHGQLLGGEPSTALNADALVAVFNDAGRPGGELSGGRLSALDGRHVAAATVDAQSARIGDGRSTYFDGVLSAVNATAAELGASSGMTSKVLAELVLRNRPTAAKGD